LRKEHTGGSIGTVMTNLQVKTDLGGNLIIPGCFNRAGLFSLVLRKAYKLDNGSRVKLAWQ